MRWNVFHEVDGGWQWECINPSGEVEARRRGFYTHAECMADAVKHGYPGDPIHPDEAPPDVRSKV
ncbi:MAG: hypothetical protein ACXWCY_32605 [Burkholderiales bacterium]